MVELTDEIIEKLKSHVFPIPIKDVREPFSTKEPVYPMITVNNMRNSTKLQLQGEEIWSRQSYRFEIYARDTAHEGKVYTKRQVSSMIGNELDKLIRTTYGLRRVGEPVRLPYGSDGTIMRFILTYTGIVDNRTMIIYQ